MALICQGVPSGVGGCPQDRRRILLDLVWLMASAVCCFESCIWQNDHRYRGRIFSLEDGGVSGLAFAQLEPRAGSPAVQALDPSMEYRWIRQWNRGQVQALGLACR